MSKKRGNRGFRIEPKIAAEMGLPINPSSQYRLTEKQIEEYYKLKYSPNSKDLFFKPDTTANDFGNESETETNQYEPNRSPVLSAMNPDGTIMTPERYCEVYGLDPSQIKSTKLVTHTGTPYYNIASQSRTVDKEVVELDLIKKVDELVSSYTPKIPTLTQQPTESKVILQLFISDTHIGMDTNQSGLSLYGGSWSKKDLFDRRDVIIQKLSEVLSSVGDELNCIQVINLGDFADGFGGYTVRKGHELPQNMNDEEVFDTGVEFLTSILEYIVDAALFNKLIWYNVCNSNHSSSFDYFICQAFKGIARSYFHRNIEVINERKFIGHFTYGRHTEIITHGKDDVSMKFGFKAQLDQKGKEKIDGYIKFHKLLTLGTFLHFHKGDSHQLVIDRSEDFDFTSYLALAPASGWVQVNFKPGRSGFSIVIKDTDRYTHRRNDYEFDWGNNLLR